MNLQLAGKRALVTGASSGIGVEIARLFAAEGVAVAVQGRDAARTGATVDAIVRDGGQAIAAIGDLTSDEGAEMVASRAVDALGCIDILVNNAGGGSHTDVRPWDRIPVGNYAETYNLNVLAGLRLVHRLAPAMADRGWGRIVNISSSIARQGMGMMHDYSAAKIAQENIALNLSLNLAPSGVTVNTVVPGLTMTPTARDYIGKLRDEHGWADLETERRYIAEFAPQPVPRLGRPEEIAHAVLFLASPLSDYTTGAVLRVDGGMSRAF